MLATDVVATLSAIGALRRNEGAVTISISGSVLQRFSTQGKLILRPECVRWVAD
jgi:hypothetical protein